MANVGQKEGGSCYVRPQEVQEISVCAIFQDYHGSVSQPIHITNQSSYVWMVAECCHELDLLPDRKFTAEKENNRLVGVQKQKGNLSSSSVNRIIFTAMTVSGASFLLIRPSKTSANAPDPSGLSRRMTMSALSTKNFSKRRLKHMPHFSC